MRLLHNGASAMGRLHTTELRDMVRIQPTDALADQPRASPQVRSVPAFVNGDHLRVWAPLIHLTVSKLRVGSRSWHRTVCAAGTASSAGQSGPTQLPKQPSTAARPCRQRCRLPPPWGNASAAHGFRAGKWNDGECHASATLGFYGYNSSVLSYVGNCRFTVSVSFGANTCASSDICRVMVSLTLLPS